MIDPSWFEPVRAYCERTGTGFWAEPLNAVSNGAFLAAAGAAALRERMAARPDPAARGLAGLVAVVGLGSFLFHTLANRWSLLADVIPIGLFIYAYVLLALRRLLGLPTRLAAAGTLAFAAFNLGFSAALDAVSAVSTGALSNGSIDYVPALLALLGVGLALRLRRSPARRAAGLAILGLAGLFLLSLSLRTLDLAACPTVHSGTHFLWHLLNAALLYGLIAVAIRARDQAT